MAITQFPFDTDQPKVRVKLPVGVHVLQLVVEDHAGLRSAPARVTIVVERAGVEIESISPTAGRQGETVSVTVTGKKLTTVHRVEFAGGGLMVSKLSATETALRFSLAIAADAAPGLRALTLFTSVGELAGPPSVGFTIQEVAVGPSITDIQPKSGRQGDIMAVTITGERLANAMSVIFEGTGIKTLEPDAAPTWIRLKLEIDKDAGPGPRPFTVITPQGSAKSPEGEPFTIEAQSVVPVIRDISPSTGLPGDDPLNVTISGQGLAETTSIEFEGEGIHVTNLVPTEKSVGFTLEIDKTAKAGPRRFILHTATGTQISSGGITFEVKEAVTPKITGIDPDGGLLGERTEVKVIGVGLAGTQRVEFDDPGIKVEEGSVSASHKKVSFVVNLANASSETTTRLHQFTLRGADFELGNPPKVAFAAVQAGDDFSFVDRPIGRKGVFDAVIVGDFRRWTNTKAERVEFDLGVQNGYLIVDKGIAASGITKGAHQVRFRLSITDAAQSGPHNVTVWFANGGIGRDRAFTVVES